jgi:hypothetical protein
MPHSAVEAVLFYTGKPSLTPIDGCGIEGAAGKLEVRSSDARSPPVSRFEFQPTGA